MLAIPFYKTLSLWFLWHCFPLIFFLCLASLQEVPVFTDPLNVGEALLNSHPGAILISFMVGLLSLCWWRPLCPTPPHLPWAPDVGCLMRPPLPFPFSLGDLWVFNMHYIPNCKPPPPLSLYLRGYPRLSESTGLHLWCLLPHPHSPALPINLHRLSTRTPGCLPSAPLAFMVPRWPNPVLSHLVSACPPPWPLASHLSNTPPLGSERDICETQI